MRQKRQLENRTETEINSTLLFNKKININLGFLYKFFNKLKRKQNGKRF